MKKIIIVAFLVCLTASSAAAQEDVTVLSETAVDSTLLGLDIFYMVGHSSASEGKITIDQPASMVTAMKTHKTRNASKHINGYRVRIFFDNSRNARAVSEQVASQFSALYPSVGVYRGYENPYFKVTVGNFRTKADATKFLNSIKGQFPSGFIVRETISYPSF